jgi:hypothetical protein
MKYLPGLKRSIINVITRIILQDRKSLLYFKDLDEWTSDVNQAADFAEVFNANTFRRRTERTSLEVIIVAQPGEREAVLPAA